MPNFIIFGAPGAGKGTQAQKIALNNSNLIHLSTGALLRKEIEKKTEFGEIVKKTVSQGALVDNKIVDELVKNQILKNSQKTGFIFDGYPRTISQANSLDSFLKNENLPITFNLEVDDSELLKRLILRAKKDGRSDDKIEVIKNRLKVYQEQTLPLLDFYSSKKRLININGNGSIEEIYKKIQNIIDNL